MRNNVSYTVEIVFRYWYGNNDTNLDILDYFKIQLIYIVTIRYVTNITPTFIIFCFYKYK